MVYEFDDEARLEAEERALSTERVGELREQCRRKASEFGCEGVRAHRVEFTAAAWDDLDGLPDSALRSGFICRGDVLDIGRRVREGTAPAKDLLIASSVWGWGTTGYGPHRLRQIVDAAGGRLESALGHVRDLVFEDRGSFDPIRGYAQLYGGWDYERRAPAGAEPWDRLHGYGPAFFTKFLYFLAPGALILDNRLARAVHDLCDMRKLVTDDGRSLAWTPYRYAVYLHWMRHNAQAVGVRPELLEVTLFEPPGPLTDEGEAAD